MAGVEVLIVVVTVVVGGVGVFRFPLESFFALSFLDSFLALAFAAAIADGNSFPLDGPLAVLLGVDVALEDFVDLVVLLLLGVIVVVVVVVVVFAFLFVVGFVDDDDDD